MRHLSFRIVFISIAFVCIAPQLSKAANKNDFYYAVFWQSYCGLQSDYNNVQSISDKINTIEDRSNETDNYCTMIAEAYDFSILSKKSVYTNRVLESLLDKDIRYSLTDSSEISHEWTILIVHLRKANDLLTKANISLSTYCEDRGENELSTLNDQLVQVKLELDAVDDIFIESIESQEYRTKP